MLHHLQALNLSTEPFVVNRNIQPHALPGKGLASAHTPGGIKNYAFFANE
ncbi:hypothetical protein [Pseudodesulfovibrio sp. S3]|nr:hypothetical protein [Pseudodesulfovibrio sp. S3]